MVSKKLLNDLKGKTKKTEYVKESYAEHLGKACMGDKLPKETKSPLSCTAYHVARRPKRSNSYGGKGRFTLHQEFQKIIKAAQSDAQIDKKSAKCSSLTKNVSKLDDSNILAHINPPALKSENDEQIVPSSTAPALLNIQKDSDCCADKRKCNDKCPTSPIQKMLGQIQPTSHDNDLMYLPQLARSDPSSYVSGDLKNSVLDIENLMNEFFDQSKDLQNDNLVGDTYIDICSVSQEIYKSLSSEGLIFNYDPSISSSDLQSVNAQSGFDGSGLQSPCSTVDIHVNAQCVGNEEEPETLIMAPTKTEECSKDPQNCSSVKDPPKTSLCVQNSLNKGTRSILYNQKKVDTITEALVDTTEGIGNHQALVVNVKTNSTETSPIGQETCLNEFKEISSDSSDDTEEDMDKSSQDLFGDLSLSHSQFLVIDAKCQEERNNSPQLQGHGPDNAQLPQSKSESTDIDPTTLPALDLTWTQKVAQGRQRLQTVTQELSRLNALVLRARRTLWPQPQNDSRSAQQGPSTSNRQTTVSNFPRPTATNYPDWNYL